MCVFPLLSLPFPKEIFCEYFANKLPSLGSSSCGRLKGGAVTKATLPFSDSISCTSTCRTDL